VQRARELAAELPPNVAGFDSADVAFRVAAMALEGPHAIPGDAARVARLRKAADEMRARTAHRERAL
jgi:hypothetical protein